MILGSPDKVQQQLVHWYSQLKGKTTKVKKHFWTHRTKEKCITDKNIKGHFIFWVLCCCSHCINTATAQSLFKAQKRCVHVPPLELTTGKDVYICKKQVFNHWSVPLLCISSRCLTTKAHVVEHQSTVEFPKGRGWGKHLGKEPCKYFNLQRGICLPPLVVGIITRCTQATSWF